MGTTIYSAGNSVTADDYHQVMIIGKTKSGGSIKITLPEALNISGNSLDFKDKDDVINSVTFTAVYNNTNIAEGSVPATYHAPYKLEVTESTDAGEADNIIIGTCLVYIDQNQVALCRGGAKFEDKPTYRQQTADGDFGPVRGRIVMEGRQVTLTINALTWIKNTMIKNYFTDIEVNEG